MIVLTGVSHLSAPLHLRERLAVSTDELPRVRAALRARLGSAVLLATCGRLEVYAGADETNATTVLATARSWLAERAGLPAGALDEIAITGAGEEAARHLLRVACGLESAVQGEDEILGQVRRAWLDGAREAPLPHALDAAFRLAVRTGRQARRQAGSSGWTSLADSAASHVARTVSGLARPRVLIAGSGPMGRRVAAALRDHFAGDAGQAPQRLELTMAGRTPERTAARAAEHGAIPETLDRLPEALHHADAAVVALRTPRALVYPDQLAPRPPERPLRIIDLSLPRAVAPEVAEVPGVALYDLDHLAGGTDGPARWDADGRARVEQLVELALLELDTLGTPSDARATLAALRLRADGIRRAQLALTLRRLPHLDAESRWVLDALTRSIVNRLLHEPTLRLRADREGEAARQVRGLFRLEGDAERGARNAKHEG